MLFSVSGILSVNTDFSNNYPKRSPEAGWKSDKKVFVETEHSNVRKSKS